MLLSRCLACTSKVLATLLYPQAAASEDMCTAFAIVHCYSKMVLTRATVQVLISCKCKVLGTLAYTRAAASEDNRSFLAIVHCD